MGGWGFVLRLFARAASTVGDGLPDLALAHPARVEVNCQKVVLKIDSRLADVGQGTEALLEFFCAADAVKLGERNIQSRSPMALVVHEAIVKLRPFTS
jgi:hypothetical protein